MDAENIPQLTAAQTRVIAKTVIDHRPEDLIDAYVGAGKVPLVAISRGGSTYGSWRLEFDGGDALLCVSIGDNMYAERIPEEFPDRFDRITAGLELWVKAVKAGEFKALLSNDPTIGHLNPERTIDPSTYSPTGYAQTW